MIPMRVGKLSDEQLMRRLDSSEVEAALSKLYDRYSRTVFGVGLKMLGERSLAEELVQEVFLKVWRSSHTFDPSRGSFSTWLFRVTRSVAVDLHRKRAHGVNPIPNGIHKSCPSRITRLVHRRSWTSPGCRGGCLGLSRRSTRRTGR